ncbi:ChrR family anti-sigma-E factor [Bradyrhizobium sp. CCGE-LA001]|uniref:ChrR family anti-sigma-E factor n=1 Tax=Bradyrhizobium sp. CCGE-LA001 TaxID=1223566 RepID=UPI0002AAAB0B|nr:ChrR family anti-sigma-E factor [Bradyrhizobium sp. CCGE-LA001]AMA55586.1 transcriptional regulator [Bradyrhizobium sp. CCGE-LA001]
MTISHHPPEDLLADFAAGKLEEAHQLVVGVHVAGCPRCTRFVQAIEQLAGAALEDVAPVPIATDAFDRVMSRIHEAPKEAVAPALASDTDDDVPPALRKYRIGKRRRVAPGLSLRPIELSGQGQARAFLLRSAPGSRMLEHTHTGTELTLVLEGSFSHEGGHFGPGDFDYGDDEVEHRPIVGNEGPCLCLVAMTGDLRMNGFLGRLIGPFVRL